MRLLEAIAVADGTFTELVTVVVVVVPAVGVVSSVYGEKKSCASVPLLRTWSCGSGELPAAASVEGDDSGLGGH